MSHTTGIVAGLFGVTDAASRIPRSEVQEIADLVMEHLSAFLSGCRYTICGG